MNIENGAVTTSPNWEKYWAGARSIYFTFCNLLSAVNDYVWNGTFSECLVSLGCNVLVGNMVVFAKCCADGSSFIKIDVSHIPVSQVEKQKLLEYIFALLTYASCKIQAERFGKKDDADALFIAKAQILGYVDNPILGKAQIGGKANCIISQFIAGGFAEDFDLQRYCDAYPYAPVAADLAAVREWNNLDHSCKFSIGRKMATSNVLRTCPQGGVGEQEDKSLCSIDIDKFRALEPRDRIRLMRYNPQLIQKENCVDFKLIDWLNLTEITATCKDWWQYKSFVKMPSYCWVKYILLFPDQASRCPYNQLRGRDWALLLQKDPSYASKCDFDSFNGDDWEDLLSVLPDYAKYCDISRFTDNARLRIVKAAPILANEHDIQSFSPWDLYVAINKCPSIVGKIEIQKLPPDLCRVIYKNNPYRIMLEKDPLLIDTIDTSAFSGEDWVRLVKKQPSLFARINFDVLNEYDWIDLMEQNFNVQKVCRWEKISADAWVYVLSQPKLRVKYDRYCNFTILSEDDWSQVIKFEPHYAWRCQCLNKISKDARKALYIGTRIFPLTLIRTDDFTAADWVEIIVKNPEVYGECDTTSLSERQLTYVEYRLCQYYWHCAYNELDSEDEKIKYRMRMHEVLDDVKYGLELERGDDAESVVGWRMWFANNGFAETETDRYYFCEPVECDYDNCVGKVRAYKEGPPEIDGCYHKCYLLTLSPDVRAPDNIISVEPCDKIYNAIIDEFAEDDLDAGRG